MARKSSLEAFKEFMVQRHSDFILNSSSSTTLSYSKHIPAQSPGCAIGGCLFLLGILPGIIYYFVVKKDAQTLVINVIVGEDGVISVNGYDATIIVDEYMGYLDPERLKKIEETPVDASTPEGKTAQIIIISVIGAVLLLCAISMIITNQSPTYNTSIDVYEEVPLQASVGYDSLSFPVDIADFKGTTIESVIAKYGEPTYQVENELPVFSSIEFDTDQYNVLIDYKKGEDIIHGGLFVNKLLRCNEHGISPTQIENYIKSLKLEYKGIGDWEKSETMFNEQIQYVSSSYEGWGSIKVKCNDNNKVYGNIMDTEYMEWFDL